MMLINDNDDGRLLCALFVLRRDEKEVACSPLEVGKNVRRKAGIIEMVQGTNVHFQYHSERIDRDRFMWSNLHT